MLELLRKRCCPCAIPEGCRRRRPRGAQLEFLVLSDKTGRPEFAARAEGAVLTVHQNNSDRVRGLARPCMPACLPVTEPPCLLGELAGP